MFVISCSRSCLSQRYLHGKFDIAMGMARYFGGWVEDETVYSERLVDRQPLMRGEQVVNVRQLEEVPSQLITLLQSPYAEISKVPPPHFSGSADAAVILYLAYFLRKLPRTWALILTIVAFVADTAV